MAVQGAAARMMHPAMYWSASARPMKAANTTRKNSHARNAMENGFTSQFTIRVITSPAGFLPTLRMAVKSTFIIMGVIMSQIRTAMGALIWLPSPNSRPRRAWTTAGTSFPRATPATMHPATQRVRYRSKSPRRCAMLAPSGGLHSADERAHKLAVHVRGDGIHIDSLSGQELAGVVDAVDARGFHFDPLETGRRQLAAVFVLLQRPGHASHPQKHVLADLGRHFAFCDHIGNSHPAARFQHPESLGQHPVFVGGKVNDAVRDDDIHGVVRERDALDLPLQELDVCHAGFALVLFRQGEHLVGHVQAIRLARRANAPRGEQHVDAAARTEVEHDFSRIQPGERGGIAASEARQHGGVGQFAGLVRAVEVARDRIAATAASAARSHSQGGLSVLLFYDFGDVFRTHMNLSYRQI